MTVKSLPFVMKLRLRSNEVLRTSQTMAFVGMAYGVWAENDLPYPMRYVERSPNVTALSKFCDIPTHLSTGTPSISVPLNQCNDKTNGCRVVCASKRLNVASLLIDHLLNPMFIRL